MMSQDVWLRVPDLPNYVNSGGRYCVQSVAPPVSPTPTPSTPSTPTPTPGTPTPTPVTPTPSPTITPSPFPGTQMTNLSTRMRVQTGENVGIGGFILTGSVPKRVILRAIGPSLTRSCPRCAGRSGDGTTRPGGFVTITNDNWRDDPQAAAILALVSPRIITLESAIVRDLNSREPTPRS